MKKKATEAITKIFCENNNINAGTLKEKIKIVTSESYAPFLLFIESLDTEEFIERNNPFDGFFINMIHRASNTLAGMVSLISTGHLQEAEVISRTLTESTLTIQYLLKNDSFKNLSHYIASYYVGEKRRNDIWKTVLGESDIHPHNRLIDDKVLVENTQKEICQNFIESSGSEWPLKPQSASIEKIFKTLDKEVEYRTVYRAMCGQSHHNQEDLINGLLYSLTANSEKEEKYKRKKHSFSIFICLWGMRYFLETLEILGKYYQFNSVQEQSKLSLEVLDRYHIEINKLLKINDFSTGWCDVVVDGI